MSHFPHLFCLALLWLRYTISSDFTAFFLEDVNTVLCNSFGMCVTEHAQMTMSPWQRGRLYQWTPNCMLWWSFFTKSSQAIWSAVLLSLQERNVGLGWGKYQFRAGAKKWHSVTTVGSSCEVLDSWAKNYLCSGAVQERTGGKYSSMSWAAPRRVQVIGGTRHVL